MFEFSPTTTELKHDVFRVQAQLAEAIRVLNVSADADLAENPPFPVGSLVEDIYTKRTYKVLGYRSEFVVTNLRVRAECQHIKKNGTVGETKWLYRGDLRQVVS